MLEGEKQQNTAEFIDAMRQNVCARHCIDAVDAVSLHLTMKKIQQPFPALYLP